MEQTKTYENFPLWIVAVSNVVSLLTYGMGVFVMIHLGWLVASIYLAYILLFEIRLVSTHCVNCYYWGKTCGFGKGRVSSLFFKKGDASKFCSRKMTWKDMIPDMLIVAIPLITAIVLIIQAFDILLIVAVLALLTLSSAGNAYIRGSLTCKYCKQRELGCPADRLFNKNQT